MFIKQSTWRTLLCGWIFRIMLRWFYVRVGAHADCVWLFATLWTVAHQAPLSTGFPRQKYWSGLLFPSPRDLPDSGIEPVSRISCIGRQVFTTVSPRMVLYNKDINSAFFA